ncbi:hypothetical protein ACFXJ8_23740 [Nonomuraea sp. NPDC059194]|uniref:hypothetical protein n=1 Tax=Nonomuraea sp. NPDC059194 TaxID=3346764 RepID=UPI0036AC8A6A
MSPPIRKLVLTTHVTSSVGWLGAVVVFLALALIGLTAPDARTVRAAYLVMEPAAWYTLVPLAVASLLTGIVQSLGSVWGLFRHYWVVFKLLINLGAIVVLLMYTQTLGYLARVAAQTPSSGMLRSPSVVLHAVLALLLLLVAAVLSVYKPRGRTRYGHAERH